MGFVIRPLILYWRHILLTGLEVPNRPRSNNWTLISPVQHDLQPGQKFCAEWVISFVQTQNRSSHYQFTSLGIDRQPLYYLLSLSASRRDLWLWMDLAVTDNLSQAFEKLGNDFGDLNILKDSYGPHSRSQDCSNLLDVPRPAVKYCKKCL